MANATPTPASTATVTLEVNGQRHQLAVRHHWSLLDVLREQLDLTGAKRGCDRGECGSCTVLLAGRPVYSCQVLAVCSDAAGTTHRIRLTQTDDAREDPGTPYRAAWSLGEALAEALHVPARYKDYR